MNTQSNPIFELWLSLQDFIEAELDEASGKLTVRNLAPSDNRLPRIVFKDVRASTRSTSVGGGAHRLNPGESIEIQLNSRNLAEDYVQIEVSLDFEQYFRFKPTLEPGRSQIERIRAWLRANEQFDVLGKVQSLIAELPEVGADMTLSEIQTLNGAPTQLTELMRAFNGDIGALTFLLDDERPEQVLDRPLGNLRAMVKRLADATAPHDISLMESHRSEINDWQAPNSEFQARINALRERVQ